MLVRCKKCGWIHAGQSLGTVEDYIREFNSIYVQLTLEQKEEFYQSTPARLKDYQACHRCRSSYQQMEVVDSKDPRVVGKFRVQTLKAVLLPYE